MMTGMAATAMTTAAERRLGVIAVAVATCVWATGTILAKSNDLSGPHFAMFRLGAGVVVSGVALLVTRRRLTWTTLRACAPGGVLFAADIGLHFSAVKRTNIADVAMIGALAPVVIAVISTRLLGERIVRRDAALVAVSFVGVLIVAIGSSGSPSWSPLGDLLAVLGIGTWTSYWMFSRRAREHTPTIEYFASVMIGGALAMTPFALAVGGVPAAPSARDWATVVAVAIFPGFVGHTLVIWSHRSVESWRSALITQCTPVISVVLAWIFLGETVTPLVIAGGAVVVASTAMVVVGAARRSALADLDTAEPPS